MMLTVLARSCPKCRGASMERKEYRYSILGYSEAELACFACGLLLWPRSGESARQSYYRWLMDRL